MKTSTNQKPAEAGKQNFQNVLSSSVGFDSFCGRCKVEGQQPNLIIKSILCLDGIVRFAFVEIFIFDGHHATICAFSLAA